MINIAQTHTRKEQNKNKTRTTYEGQKNKEKKIIVITNNVKIKKKLLINKDKYRKYEEKPSNKDWEYHEFEQVDE